MQNNTIKISRIALVLLFSILLHQINAQVKLGLPLGHTNDIEDINFSPNGKFIVTASDDKQIIVWDLKTGKPVQLLIGHKFGVTSAFFSDDGNMIISTSIDGTVKFWDVYTGNIVASFKHPRTVFSANITKDNKYMVCNYYNENRKKEGCVWDLDTKKILHTFPNANNIIVSKTGKYYLTYDYYVIHVRDIKTGESLIKITDTEIKSVALSKDNRYIYTIAKGNEIKKWDINNMERDKIFGNVKTKAYKQHLKLYKKYGIHVSEHTDDIQSIRLIDNEKYIITASSDKTANVWNAEYGFLVFTLKGHREGLYDASYTSNNFKSLFLTSAQNEVKIWTVYGGIKHNWRPSVWVPKPTLSSDGRLVAMISESTVVSIYSTETGSLLHELRNRTYALNSVDINLKKNQFLVSSDDNSFSQINFKNMEIDKVFVGHSTISLFSSESGLDKKGVEQAVYSANRDQIVSCGRDWTIKLWDAKSGAFLKNYAKAGTKAIISPDSKYIFNYRASSDILKVISINGDNDDAKIKIDTIKRRDPSNPYIHSSAIIVSKKKNLLILSSDEGKSNFWNYKIHKFHSTVPLTVFDELTTAKSWLLMGCVYENGIIYNKQTGELDSLIGHSRMIVCGSFSPDGIYALTGAKDNTAIIWDVKTRKISHTLKGHKNAVTSCKYLDNNRIITSSVDGSVIIWDSKTGNKIAQHFIFNNNEHITLLPNNYYKTINRAEKNLHYIDNENKVLLFDQFDLKYNRPDLVLQQLGYDDLSLIQAYHKAYLKRLKKMNFTEDMLKDDFHIPEIKIENFEEMPTITDSSFVGLNLQLNDSKYKLDRINIWVNDVAVYGSSGISLRKKNLQNYTTTLSVGLAKGKNKVQVSVLNQAGAESYKETFEIECRAGKTKPDLYLITIGESKFKDANYNLTYAAKDAYDVASLFAKSKNYEKVHTKTLTNEQVTKENITALQSFLEQAEINDEVMIFIAGHGVLDENLDYFFASYDMDFNNPKQRGIAYEDLEGLLDGIKPLKKVLLIDACHSGEIDKEEVELLVVNEAVSEGGVQFRAVGNTVKPKLGMQNTSELTKALFTDLRKGTGATVISSAGGGEYAMESGEWKNGLFTYTLLKGIETGEADLNNDGEIWLKELQEYVQTQVTKLSGGKQQPTSRIENNILDYRIW